MYEIKLNKLIQNIENPDAYNIYTACGISGEGNFRKLREIKFFTHLRI